LLFVAAMSRSVLALALATTVVACTDQELSPDTGLSETRSAIVGGSEAGAGEWPDAVAVLGTEGTCSGTLIAPDVVLTAGHCAGIEPTQVIANTTDYAQPGGIRVDVARTVSFPDWQHSYDLSVLVLASPIEDVTPRAIGTACTYRDFVRETPVRLVGFGATDKLGQMSNTHLREAMTMVTDPDCTGGHGCKDELAPGGEFVAGGTGEADSCFGDSGGPVYLDTDSGPVVIGAVSRGVSGSETPCGGGGIYVRTDNVIEWIEDTAGTTIAKDDCGGVEYKTEAQLGSAGQGGGCAATSGAGGGASAGALGLVLLAIVKRRR
jgi:secreted trypsin-like serine protease